MSSILAKVGLTASASLLFSHCLSGIASIQPLARYFHSSQFWYNDNAARNARLRERYASDPEYRNRLLQKQREWTCEKRATNDTDYIESRRQSNIRWKAKKRPAHIQNYLNDAEYRDSVKRKFPKSDATIQREHLKYKENINNRYQKAALLLWIVQGTWQRRLFWETHEPLVSEARDVTPGLCSSCNGVFTRRLWWRRKKVGEKSAENTDEQSSEHILDCHTCFCDMDWEKALPLGYRGHVFGSGKHLLRQPDWTKYPPPPPSPSP
ncbi:hypothetical protein KCU71_g8103, partial [Aureobasidium melanogenum]